MEQLLGFEDPKFPNHIYKLHNTLYERKQAPKVWYECFRYFLIKKGFEIGKTDYTIFTKNVDIHLFVC